MRTIPPNINQGQTIATNAQNETIVVPYNEVNKGTLEVKQHGSATFDLSNQATWNPYHSNVMSFSNAGTIEAVNASTLSFGGTVSNGHFMYCISNLGTILAQGSTINFDVPVIQGANGIIKVTNQGTVSFGSDYGTLDSGTVLLQNGTLSLSPQKYGNTPGGMSCGVTDRTSIEFAGSRDTISIKGVGAILDSYDPAKEMLSIFAHGQTGGGWTQIEQLQVKPAFGQHIMASNFHVSGSDIIFRPS